MIDLAGLRTDPTAVPAVGDFGAAFPFATRITTPANESESGSTHVSNTDDEVTFDAFTDVTGLSAKLDA